MATFSLSWIWCWLIIQQKKALEKARNAIIYFSLVDSFLGYHRFLRISHCSSSPKHHNLLGTKLVQLPTGLILISFIYIHNSIQFVTFNADVASLRRLSSSNFRHSASSSCSSASAKEEAESSCVTLGTLFDWDRILDLVASISARCFLSSSEIWNQF